MTDKTAVQADKLRLEKAKAAENAIAQIERQFGRRMRAERVRVRLPADDDERGAGLWPLFGLPPQQPALLPSAD